MADDTSKNYAIYNFYNLQDYCNKLGICYNATYFRWLKDIINTKVTEFTYENLPGTLTTQIMETSLLFRNYLCLWKSPQLNEVVLCCYKFGGDYDLYWKPVTVDLLTISGRPLAYNVPYQDIVLVRDNDMDIIPFLTLNSWLDKIIDAEKTLDILIRLVRFPTILTGTKEQATMLKQLLVKNINYEGFVVGARGMENCLQQFDIKLPVQLMEMYELIEKYRNMALASIGIYGVDNKRERVVTQEIISNNDYVDFVYQGMLNQRKLWIKQANEKWGLNIVIKESYNINKLADYKLEAKGTEMSAKAEAKGTAVGTGVATGDTGDDEKGGTSDDK